MDKSDCQRGQKRSPFDLIMNQIRRKKSFTERRQRPSVSRFFRPSEKGDRKGIPEDGETGSREGTENTGPRTGTTDAADAELSSVVGWGRLKQFTQKLGRKPDSRSLSLSHCDLTATDLVELATLLPFLTQLEEMDLSWNDLIGGSLTALTFHLQHVCRLRLLRLSSCRLTAQDLAAFGDTLREIPLLEVLDLSWNASLGGNLQRLASSLGSGCRVKELHLVECGLTAADTEALGGALCGLPGLEVLDLSANRLLAGGFGELTPQLRNVPGLRVLRLHMCGLGPENLGMLGKAFQFLPALQELDLSCNKGAGGGFAKAIADLVQLTHLRSLDLHLCCLTEDDMQALVKVVPSVRDLTVVDLSSNKQIGGVSEMLFPSLPLTKIKRLDLNNCCLTGECYQSLASVVQCLGGLESLNLSWNKSVGGALGLLLGPLPPCCPLQEMRLSSCGLTEDDVIDLVSASKRGALACLALLNLSYNDGIGERGWLSLFQGLGSLRALVELDVSLRPSARAPASTWLPALLASAPHLPTLATLSLQRWVLTPQGKDSLEALNREGKRSIRFECDPPAASRSEDRPAAVEE